MKDIVLIVTYGRSGSTLLMGILNSHEKIKILGENNDAYSQLSNFYMNMISGLQGNKACEQNHELYGSVNSWYNDFTVGHLKTCIQHMVCSIIDPHNMHDIVGFKEIRYPSHRDKIVTYLNVLHNMLDCKFIFLTRDLKKVSISKWWADNPSACIEKLTKFESDIKQYMEDTKGVQQWHHITCEQLIEGDVTGLFKFLGLDYDKKTVQNVLKVKHSY